MSEPRRPIAALIGEQLSAVSFVMDYVEFHFDGSIVRALSNPLVQLAGERRRFPESGSRDAMCALIANKVAAVSFKEKVSLEISFAGGASLLVPLDAASQVGPEAMHWCPRDGQMEVWQ